MAELEFMEQPVAGAGLAQQHLVRGPDAHAPALGSLLWDSVVFPPLFLTDEVVQDMGSPRGCMS